MSRVVEFGLVAFSIALSARTGRVSARDLTRLLCATMRCVPEDAKARDMVLAFVEAVGGNPDEAGQGLQAALRDWLDTLPVATRSDVIKSANPGTVFSDKGVVAPGPQETAPVYPWQDRADLR